LKNFFYLNFFKGLIQYRTLFVLEDAFISNRLLTLSGFTNKSVSVWPFFNAIKFYKTQIADNLFINSVINRSINNYYSSDLFSKNSKVMSLCSLKVVSNNFSNQSI